MLKRIKKALKSNQKQLDLRAMRHLDIILAKKLVSSICPRDDFGEAKNPYISRLFRIPWVIPTRCRDLHLKQFCLEDIAPAILIILIAHIIIYVRWMLIKILSVVINSQEKFKLIVPGGLNVLYHTFAYFST